MTVGPEARRIAVAGTYVLAAVASGCGLLLQFHFESTTEAVLQTQAGKHLLRLAFVAAALLTAGLLACLVVPKPAVAWAGVVVALAVLTYGAVETNGRLRYATNPPDMLATFHPPAGAVERPRGALDASQQRQWEVPLTVPQACAEARKGFTAWADQGTVRVNPASRICSAEGERGDLHVGFNVQAYGDTTLLVVSAKPLEVWRR